VHIHQLFPRIIPRLVGIEARHAYVSATMAISTMKFSASSSTNSPKRDSACLTLTERHVYADFRAARRPQRTAAN